MTKIAYVFAAKEADLSMICNEIIEDAELMEDYPSDIMIEISDENGDVPYKITITVEKIK